MAARSIELLRFLSNNSKRPRLSKKRPSGTQFKYNTTLSPKKLARKAKYVGLRKELHKAASAVIWDRDLGGTNAVEWRVRKSGGYSVMQAIQDPGMSKLERRSLEEAIPQN